MTAHVKTEIAAGIMTLTLTRPDKMNALSNAMYSAMSDGLERAEKDASVRVVLFQGDGDNFTAGNAMNRPKMLVGNLAATDYRYTEHSVSPMTEDR